MQILFNLYIFFLEILTDAVWFQWLIVAVTFVAVVRLFWYLAGV